MCLRTRLLRLDTTATALSKKPRRLFAISKPSLAERESIGIDIQGRLGNGGEARAVLEYGGEISDEGHGHRLLAELFVTLLVIDAMFEFLLTYNRERPIDDGSVLGW